MAHQVTVYLFQLSCSPQKSSVTTTTQISLGPSLGGAWLLGEDYSDGEGDVQLFRVAVKSRAY